MSETPVTEHRPLPPATSAPDFELRSTPSQTVRLSDFRGRPVILVFYPEDWSPVCTDQLALYQEVMPEPLPVRTAVQAILLPGYLVEIEMWAVKARD